MAKSVDVQGCLNAELVYAACEVCGMERKVAVKDCLVCELLGRVNVLSSECERLNEIVDRLSIRVDRPSKASYKEALVGGNRRPGSGRPQSNVGGKGFWDIDRPDRVKEDEWNIVKNGCRPRSRDCGRDEELECRNRFASLGEGEPSVANGPSSEGPEVMVVGDSQIRYVDRAFCEKERKRRMRVCLPGAGVQDILDRYDRLVVGSGEASVVILHVGVNDVKKERSESLMKKYKDLLARVRESGRNAIVSGVLPRMNVSKEWSSRAIGLNERVRKECGDDVVFLDTWSMFWGVNELYARDGLHLSKSGVQLLSKCFEQGVQECVDKWRIREA